MYKVFSENGDSECMIWKGQSYQYQYLLNKVKTFITSIELKKIPSGSVVAIIGDFSPSSIGILMALIERNCIVVPLTNSSKKMHGDYFNIASVEYTFNIDGKDSIRLDNVSTKRKKTNNYYNAIKNTFISISSHLLPLYVYKSLLQHKSDIPLLRTIQ